MSEVNNHVIEIDEHEQLRRQRQRQAAALTNATTSSPSTTIAGIDPLEFGAGILAGVSNLLTGHPLDTLKVRLQTQSLTSGTHFTSGWDCVRQTVAKEGVLALYKGMTSPLYTSPAINAVVFTAYEQGKRLIAGPNSDRPLSHNEMALAGAYAGFVNCFVVCPVELVKAKLQVQYESNIAHSKYKSALDCLRQVARENGIRGVFKGMSACILREIPAYIAQFYTYESMKELMQKRHQHADTDTDTSTGSGSGSLSMMELMVCGAVSGVMCWTASYPQDVIKSRIQIAPDGTYRARFWDGGFIECGREALRREGWRGLWRGFGPCVVRAAVANAAGFCTYETALSWGRRWQDTRTSERGRLA